MGTQEEHVITNSKFGNGMPQPLTLSVVSTTLTLPFFEVE